MCCQKHICLPNLWRAVGGRAAGPGAGANGIGGVVKGEESAGLDEQACISKLSASAAAETSQDPTSH
jgi:hypothetical protein